MVNGRRHDGCRLHQVPWNNMPGIIHVGMMGIDVIVQRILHEIEARQADCDLARLMTVLMQAGAFCSAQPVSPTFNQELT